MSDQIRDNHLTRRGMLKAIVGTVGALALEACAPAPTPQVVEKEKVVEKEVTRVVAGTPQVVKETVVVTVEPPTATPAELVEVEWWGYWGGADFERWKVMAAQFTSRNPSIKVNLEAGAPGGGDYHEVLLTRIAGGTAPDLAAIYWPPVGLAARGSLLAIDDVMASGSVGM